MNRSLKAKKACAIVLKRIWIWVAVTAVVSILFGGTYLIGYKLRERTVLYRSDAMYYLDFDLDRYNETLCYFNDYTWNDIIDSDEIAGRAAKASGIDRELIELSTNVPTMSGVWYIHLQVDTDSSDKCEAVQDAMRQALEEYAEQSLEFNSIYQMSIEPVVRLQEDDLAGRYLVLGAILGFIVGGLGLLGMSIVADGIYLTEDAEELLGIPAYYDMDEDRLREVIGDGSVGIIDISGNTAGAAHLAEVFKADIIEDAAKDKDYGTVLIILPYGSGKSGGYARDYKHFVNLGIKADYAVIREPDRQFVRICYGDRRR